MVTPRARQRRTRPLAGGGRGAGLSGHGFTLVEVVIVVVLLLMLGGIIFATAGGPNPEITFSETSAQIADAVAIARGHARDQDAVMVLAARASPGGGLRLVCYRPPDSALASLIAPSPKDAGAEPAMDSDRDQSRADAPLPPAEVIMQLPPGFTIEPGMVPDDDGGTDEPVPPIDAGEAGVSGKAALEQPRADVVLALLLPDGRCHSGGFVLADRTGRRARASVGALAGTVTFERLETPAGMSDSNPDTSSRPGGVNPPNKPETSTKSAPGEAPPAAPAPKEPVPAGTKTESDKNPASPGASKPDQPRPDAGPDQNEDPNQKKKDEPNPEGEPR